MISSAFDSASEEEMIWEKRLERRALRKGRASEWGKHMVALLSSPCFLSRRALEGDEIRMQMLLNGWASVI